MVYFGLRLSRMTKRGGIYDTGSHIFDVFGASILDLDKMGRELTGMAVLRCIALADESVFSTFISNLMTGSLGIMSLKNFNSFYSHKQGKRNQSSTPMATLWNYWKTTVRELLTGWSKELGNPSSRLMINYSTCPLAEHERGGVPEHLQAQCAGDVNALLTAQVIKVNVGSVSEVEFIPAPSKPYHGWFGYFFDMVKSLMGVDIKENTDKDLAYWIKFFGDQEVSTQVSRQPMVIFFVYLEFLNQEYRHTNGKTFFAWYQLDSVLKFKKWFTVVLQKYILVSTIVASKEDITFGSWEDHRSLVDNNLMETVDAQVVADRAEALATDGHFACIKVCSLLVILFLFLLDSTLVYVGY
jgi:hypothetical protein